MKKALVTFVVVIDEEQAKATMDSVTRGDLELALESFLIDSLDNYGIDYSAPSVMVMVRPVKEEEG